LHIKDTNSELKKDEWGTPQEFFDKLDAEFDFTLDPCANFERKLKTMNMYDKHTDGLSCRWFGRVFVNPPYSGNNIEKWVRKVNSEFERDECDAIVMLIPTTKTGTKWFRGLVLDKGVEIRFVTGRINFVPLAGQPNNSNPLYSMILIWRKDKHDRASK